MNAVIGIGRLLSDTDLNLEQQQYVQMINNSGHLLLTIINDILDYSKIEAGQLQLAPRASNIADVVETAVLLCNNMAAGKSLPLTWHIDPSLPACLTLDPIRLQQILLNFLSNAIKFTRAPGVVHLSASGHFLTPPVRTGTVTGRAAGGTSAAADEPPATMFELSVSVRDSGIGISRFADTHAALALMLA